MKILNDNPVSLSFSGSIGTVASVLDLLGQRPIGSTYSAIERVLKKADADILAIKFIPGVVFFCVDYLDSESKKMTATIFWDPKDNCRDTFEESGGASTHYKSST